MMRQSLRFADTVLGVALLACASAAPAQDKVPPQAYARVNAALVENHVLPRYERLAAAAAALADAAEDFCARPDSAGLMDMRGRFRDVMDAWMGVQHLRFGPAELFMRAYRLYFWPQARGKVGEAVRTLLEAGDVNALAPDRFRESSVAVQGLPAIEYLLYGEPERLMAGDKAAEFRCALLGVIAASTQSTAADIVRDWRGGDAAFAQATTEPRADSGYFGTHREATLAFFQSLHDGLQLIADVKLKPVVGESSEVARPRLAESRRSSRALRNIVLNLEALEALYTGGDRPGLSELVRKHGEDAKLDALMRKAFRMTVATAESIDRPLTEAVTDAARRPRVEKLLTQVRALKQIVRTRLAAALDLTVGFNALDGD